MCMYSSILDYPCQGVICSISGETCDEISGTCKCGAAETCDGKSMDGVFCDVEKSVCKYDH